jgi:signal transduction histidine kinase
VGERKPSVGPDPARDRSGGSLYTAHSGLHVLCHECHDPVAVISIPQGALLEVNDRFRKIFDVPEPLPLELTLQTFGGAALDRILRGWDGASQREIRKIAISGVTGRARLMPIPSTFPRQAFFHFMPSAPGVPADEGKLRDLLEDGLQQIRNFERLRSLGETAAVIVHEIRIPLSSILLGLESTRNSAVLDPSLRGRLDVALEQVARLDRLLGSIRDFAHPHRLKFSRIDVRKTISNALASVEASLRGPRTSVVLEVRPDPLTLHADPDRLAEAIQNLVVNAVEAMSEGGTIRIWATPSVSRRGWIEMRVSDEGTGIPLAHRNRIFQPFFTTKRHGIGLGLAIVKKIVELHGGFISLTGTPGKGTTVVLELPSGGLGV